MPVGLSQIGDSYRVGKADHIAAVAVTSAFSQVTITTGKSAIEIINVGDNTVFYGGSGVTTANGFPMYRRTYKTWNNVSSSWSIYVCCGSGLNSELRVVEYD